MYSEEMVGAKIEQAIRITLRLGDDVVLRLDSDLVNEIGLDSIEAFESVAILHELLGVRIPENLDLRAMSSIGGMARYVSAIYDAATIDKFMKMDVVKELSKIQSADEFD